MSKSMLIKTLTAFAIIAVVLPPLIMGGYLLVALLVVVSLLASYEMATLRDQQPHWGLTILFELCIALLVIFIKHFSYMLTIVIVVYYLAHLFDSKFTADHLAFSVLITLILSLAYESMLSMYGAQNNLKFFGVLYIGLACYLCDTGAYFVGVSFGKHKMIPSISPNKTWEGAIGGYLIGFLGSLLYGWFVCTSLPKPFLIVCSMILPVTAEIGDLAFSTIKRYFKVKDFGSLLPGHGGVLDRIDSLLFCMMIFRLLYGLWGI